MKSPAASPTGRKRFRPAPSMALAKTALPTLLLGHYSVSFGLPAYNIRTSESLLYTLSERVPPIIDNWLLESPPLWYTRVQHSERARVGNGMSRYASWR